ncbi:MAG: hypothetical protein ACQEQO_08910 [Thermodesulfobacteriota bacterium]
MDFFEVTGGLPLGEKGAVFSQFIRWGTCRPRFIGAMRSKQNLSASAGSPMDTLLKRPAREPWN